jgi:hypothetical protein
MSGADSSERPQGAIRVLAGAMFGPPVLSNALRVSLFDEICLNAINQGPKLWRGEPPSWSKLALNFLVPFQVSSRSGARARPAQESE